jgi:SAM-dependent methyltransferase
MNDKQTLDYFDQFTPHYDPKRFSFALKYLQENSNSNQSLIDIGCGDGATLYLIKENTHLKEKLFGLDISNNYLSKAKKLVGCQIIEGSILDSSLVDKYAGCFDFCTLGAVIHHLIGDSRKQSFEFASQCLSNSIKLLKPNGCLIIFEPTHSPSYMMDIIFWIKKIFGRLSNERLELFSKWANFGQPVVSYYTPSQLLSFLDKVPNAKIVDQVIIDQKRMGFIIQRVGLGVIIKKIDQ